jgi:hypothetical protein
MRFAFEPFAADHVLATSQLGKKVFAALVGEAMAPTEPTLLYLDFSNVEVATTSFLRDSVVAFRNHARSHLGTLYPVVSNLSAGVREELHEFLRSRADALALCRLSAQEHPSHPEVIGQLDGKQLATLRAVVASAETDAVELGRQFASEESVGTTAWNNRLATLSAKGLLIETSAGRAKRYRPVLENLKYGP